MSTLRLILATVLAALAAAPAQAEIIGWRYISGNLAATTSTCIGSNESPVCVADTVIACRVAARNGPRWGSEDELDVEPCVSSRDFARVGFLGPAGGIRQGGFLYFYLLEVYPLANERHPSRGREPSPTDIVVDVYAGTCLATPPLPAERGDGWDPASRICEGFPFDFLGRWSERGGHDPEGFIEPSVSLIMREAEDGYHVLDGHWDFPTADNMGGRRLFGPDRWYDSLERLLMIHRSDPPY